VSKIIVYDVPVILKSYYDSIDKKAFELNIIQKLLKSATFSKYRMLTDFVNLKFANCYGTMRNMQYNRVTQEDVLDMNLKQVPSSGIVGDRYIVSGAEGGSWQGKKDMIAQLEQVTPAMQWSFIQPKVDDIVYVQSKEKKYVFGDLGWVVPEFTIPLKISLELVRESLSPVSEVLLIPTVKETLVESFKSRFGIQKSLFRSEIIDVCHNINGVEHVRLIEPKCNIFYNYSLEDLSEQELVEYVPEFLYFTESDITVTVLSSQVKS
jgi:hypothetical protein